MDKFPVVSRTGDLGYVQWNHQTDLYLVSVKENKEERLTAHTRENFSARFCPAGRTLVYHSGRTGNNEIWLLDTETRTERQLTSHEADDRFPDCSPDGRDVVFLSNRDGGMQVWTMSINGGVPRRLTGEQVSVPVPP